MDKIFTLHITLCVGNKGGFSMYSIGILKLAWEAMFKES